RARRLHADGRHQYAAGGEPEPVQEAELRPGEGLRADRPPRHHLLHDHGAAGSQVSQAMLRSMGKIDFIDVPYKGLPQAITDVLGGQISFTFADLANALAQIKGGKLRGIAVTSAKRSPLAADVPAIAEELPGYELIAWFALVAPARTPAPVIARVHEVIAKSLAKP